MYGYQLSRARAAHKGDGGGRAFRIRRFGCGLSITVCSVVRYPILACFYTSYQFINLGFDSASFESPNLPGADSASSSGPSSLFPVTSTLCRSYLVSTWIPGRDYTLTSIGRSSTKSLAACSVGTASTSLASRRREGLARWDVNR